MENGSSSGECVQGMSWQWLFKFDISQCACIYCTCWADDHWVKKNIRIHPLKIMNIHGKLEIASSESKG